MEQPSTGNAPPAATTASPGVSETYLLEMNQSFAQCLSLVCPSIQYPPHCRFNPVQQDAADTTEIESRLEEFFLHAKQIELLLLNAHLQKEEPHTGDTTVESNGTSDKSQHNPQRQHQNITRAEVEHEIALLEHEIGEKNDLIEKYSDVLRGWEGKFKRLESRINPEKE